MRFWPHPVTIRWSKDHKRWECTCGRRVKFPGYGPPAHRSWWR